MHRLHTIFVSHNNLHSCTHIHARTRSAGRRLTYQYVLYGNRIRIIMAWTLLKVCFWKINIYHTPTLHTLLLWAIDRLLLSDQCTLCNKKKNQHENNKTCIHFCCEQLIGCFCQTSVHSATKPNLHTLLLWGIDRLLLSDQCTLCNKTKPAYTSAVSNW